jgi:hypothetical protein
VHSAELTFKGKVEIIQDERLRECNYGKYNAQSSEIVEPMQEEHITKRFPEGESYEDVKKRIGDFLDFLKKNYTLMQDCKYIFYSRIFMAGISGTKAHTLKLRLQLFRPQKKPFFYQF